MANDRDFDSLNATNYATWAYRMEMRLTKMDLWDVVASTAAPPNVSPNHATMLRYRKRQRLAKAEIVQYVSDQQLVHTKNDDPKVIWEKLQTVHSARGFGTRMSLRRWLHRMKWSDFVNPNMRTWITAVEEVVQYIRDRDGEVDDEDVIVVLTDSLPDSYQSLIVSFDSLPEDELTVEYVIARLIKEESRQDRDTPVLPLAASATALAARNTASAPAAPRVKRDVKDITCFKCGKKGHYQSNCPDSNDAPPAPAPPYSVPRPTGRMF